MPSRFLEPVRLRFSRVLKATIANGSLPPVYLATVLSLVLYFLHTGRILDSWSANTGAPGYDFFGLPRCGMALREVLPIANSWQTIPFGPYSTDWASHPMLCLVFGLPLTFFSPWGAYWVFSGFLTLLQVVSIFVCAHFTNLSANWRGFDGRSRLSCTLVYLCCGFFFPMYVLLNQAQYHGLSILWTLLVIIGGRGEFWGFAGSALSKPILAPVALLPVLEKNWRLVLKVVGAVAVATGGFYLWERIQFGTSSLLFLGQGGYLKLKYSVMNWNQEISFAKVLERFFDADTNFLIRILVALFCLVVAVVWMKWRKARLPAIAASLLSIFFLYGRGHEYHAVTLLPVLLALGSRREWLNPWFLSSVVLLALPTSWPLFAPYRAEGQPFEINQMMDANAFLGWIFVAEKPLALILLLVALTRGLFRKDGKSVSTSAA